MINRYTNPVQNTLEQYVPLPFNELMQAGAAIQQRGDLAEQQQMAVQAGLASMEALAPAHAQFRDKFANDYKASATSLLDKYQGNTSNPEFIRDIKRLNMQFSGDPRLQTIKQGNELYKQNQQIAAKMKAEGKLYIQPEFSGVDERGNLSANVPGVTGVNTLEDWTKAGMIAHGSMEDIGTKSTNSRNLDKWKKTLNSDVEGQAKLKQAFIQQGLSPERADQAVKNSIQGLVNQYGVETKTNTALLNYGLNERQFAYQKQQDAAKLDLDRYKAETARKKAEGKGGEDLIKAPSFNEFNNRVGSVGTVKDSEGKELATVFGSGYSQYGSSNVPVKNKTISGKIYDISSGKTVPVSKSVAISEGTSKGYLNVWVDSKSGQLLQGNAGAKQQPKIDYINGQPYAYKNGKPYRVEERTVEEISYNSTAGKKDGTEAEKNPSIKTFYREAAPKEAMREMGYSNAYYGGMGRTQHGSIYDSQNKIKLDDKFINSNQELREYYPAFKDAQKKVNNGTATQSDVDLLKQLQSYDSRKSTYDREILPYFKDQSKTKTIVDEE